MATALQYINCFQIWYVYTCYIRAPVKPRTYVGRALRESVQLVRLFLVLDRVRGRGALAAHALEAHAAGENEQECHDEPGEEQPHSYSGHHSIRQLQPIGDIIAARHARGALRRWGGRTGVIYHLGDVASHIPASASLEQEWGYQVPVADVYLEGEGLSGLRTAHESVRGIVSSHDEVRVDGGQFGDICEEEGDEDVSGVVIHNLQRKIRIVTSNKLYLKVMFIGGYK